MKLIEFSIRRPVTVLIFTIAAVVFGTVALSRLATDLLPDITYPTLTVRTGFEGAAPLEVETLITRPVENAVGVVNGVARIASSSREDVSEVTLEFDWGTNIDMAGLDVRERLDMVRLPAGVIRPVLLRFDPSRDPILRVAVFGPSDLIYLRRIAEEEIERALERVEGVAAAVVSGGLEEEIHVEIDERRLAGLGLTMNALTDRLAQENVNLTGGRLLEGQTEYLVRTVHEFVRAEELDEIVVDASRGAIVRLRDVAEVRRAHREREIVTRVDGQESVEIAIYKEGGTNTVTVSDVVQDELESIGSRLRQIDPALGVAVVTDQADYIRESVTSVLETAVLGGALAIFILYFFLRSWKATAIIGIAIPVSVVATFFLMYSSGISLNIMSLGGLTLGIGLLVDNSIVVLESIHRRREQGLGAAEAARRGAGEVGRAVIASTLTTICVFVPIVFVEGVAGQLFGDQALTVTWSLCVSLIVSLTLVPMLVSREIPAGQEPTEATERQRSRIFGFLGEAAYGISLGLARGVTLVIGLFGGALRLVLAVPVRIFDAGLRAFSEAYDAALVAVLRHPWVTVAAALLLLAASLPLAGGLGRELVPELVQGEFYVDAEFPPGTRLDVTERRLARIERLAAGIPGVGRVYGISGASNEQGGVAGETRENLGQITVRLDGHATREREEDVMRQLREELARDPDLQFRFGRPSYFSFKTPIEVEIRGHNLALLEGLGDELVARMRNIPGLADVKSSTEGGNPELQIEFDRERLASLGLSLAGVGAIVRAKVLGQVATEIQREDRQIDIRLRSAEGYRDSVDDLGRLTVLQNGRTAIPLAAVARISEVEGPAEIRRSEGDRVAVVTANLTGRDLGTVSAEIERELLDLRLPAGFDWRVGGQRQEMETSFQSMRLAVLLAIFMVYLVMASQFESLLHPFVILFSVPFAAAGVLVTLSLFHVAISIVVLIGIILLAGIVVNNAIILVDYTNQLRQEGLGKVEALRQAGNVRLRPILMTTATTVLGLLPMAVGLGEGSELRAPMALTVMGGLISSTVLTLLIIPAVYAVLDRRP